MKNKTKTRIAILGVEGAMPMPGDFHGSSQWGYLVTDDKRAQPLLKSFYKALFNHIVSLKLRATRFSTSFECAYLFYKSQCWAIEIPDHN